jgi:hypothetical protein
MSRTQDDSEEALKKERVLPTSLKTRDIPPDDPLKRHEGLKLDLEGESEGKQAADMRRSALEQARKMPTSEEK